MGPEMVANGLLMEWLELGSVGQDESGLWIVAELEKSAQ